MAREYYSVWGSGQTPFLQGANQFPAADVNSFPGPGNHPGVHGGVGVQVLNWENQSAGLSIRASGITVGSAVAVELVSNPLIYRRNLAIHNTSSNTVYLGDANVNANEGFPLNENQSISLDVQGLSSVSVYAITASSTADVRVLELG